MQALFTLYQIIEMITFAFVMLIIIQFVIGLLFAFNIVDPRNEFLAAFYTSINRFLDPVLRPIRRFLPETGSIDFSPLVLIILLNIVLFVLEGIMRSAA